MKLILGGHWCEAPEGWLALKQADQDITKRLNFDDNSVDVIFTEHVIEHITFIEGVAFLRECYRVLKPSGIIRTVAPMIETMIRFQNDEFGKRYASDSLHPFYQNEAQVLASLGLNLQYDPHPFMIDSMVRKHGHQFCWSQKLLRRVLLKIGFLQAEYADPGQSALDQATAIERTIRGVHGDNLIRDFGPQVYDPESGIVEARK